MTNGPMSPEPTEMPIEDAPAYVRDRHIRERVAVGIIAARVDFGKLFAEHMTNILTACQPGVSVVLTQEEAERWHKDCARAEAEREADERLGK